MPDSAELELARLALSVAHDSVTKQQADIRDLRTAAAALLTGAAVVVALLGGRAIDVHRLPLLVAAGVVLFLGSMFFIFTVLVAYGNHQLQEIAGGLALFDLADEEDAHIEAHERVAATYDAIYEGNDAPKRRMARRLIYAALLLVGQIATWGATIVLAEHDAATAKSACAAALIGREHVCLARRQPCDRRHEQEYERYGFVCTARAGDGRARLR